MVENYGQHETTDDQMILSISDQGLGIPKEDGNFKDFDRFYRADKGQKPAPRWYAFIQGLLIKEIVKQHNGFIWAKSDGRFILYHCTSYDRDVAKKYGRMTQKTRMSETGPFKYSILASGSSGELLHLETPKKKILVDAGFIR